MSQPQGLWQLLYYLAYAKIHIPPSFLLTSHYKIMYNKHMFYFFNNQDLHFSSCDTQKIHQNNRVFRLFTSCIKNNDYNAIFTTSHSSSAALSICHLINPPDNPSFQSTHIHSPSSYLLYFLSRTHHVCNNTTYATCPTITPLDLLFTPLHTFHKQIRQQIIFFMFYNISLKITPI